MSDNAAKEQFFHYDKKDEDSFKPLVYERLETFFLTYQELTTVSCIENGEEFVSLSSSNILFLNLDPRMTKYSGNDIYVREGVLNLLNQADKALGAYNPAYRLEVVYGYRHPAIQKASYEEIKQGMGSALNGLSELDIKETVHRVVAVPEVAGHPTGGALDVRIKTGNRGYLDMGTEIYDFSRDCYSFSPFISPEAWRNRQLLRNTMLSVGFAPFDGEWWHFSYGDREWAKYYGHNKSFYDQATKTFV